MQGHEVRFDIGSVLNQLRVRNQETLVIGPGSTDKSYTTVNGELICNMILDQYNRILHQRSYSSIVSETEAIQSCYKEKNCGPFQHLMISSLDQSESKFLIEIDVQQRLTNELKEENNFISVIRRGLKTYAKHPMALAGLFRVEKGIIKAHVMPDFIDEDLKTKQQVDDWLKFYDMQAPLNCLSVLLTEDINNSGFRLEHTHFFSDHGQAGHYHYDISPEDVHYRGYFTICQEAVIVDPVS